MPRYVIETPVPDYVGALGPIHFHAGRAEVDEIPGSIRTYCEQAGYKITDTQPAAAELAADTQETTTP